MTQSPIVETLTELLLTHSPSGCEQEIDRVLLPKLGKLADKVWQDEAGNLVAVRQGEVQTGGLGLVTHKDELGMIVKRIRDNGTIVLDTTSSARPWIYGEGPIDLLGEHEIVPAVLSFGSRHTTDDSPHPGRDGRAPTWSNAWLSTGLARKELAEKGISVGTMAVVGRLRKTPLVMGNNICGYGLDCKGGVAVLLAVLEAIRAWRLRQTIHFIITSSEEALQGVLGGVYAARKLDLDRLIAVEVGPVAPEYDTVNDARPILVYKDVGALYDPSGNRSLLAAAQRAGVELQRAALSSFGTDASWALKAGFVPRANCLCFPTENTHGYEISSISGIENTARVLVEFLRDSSAQ